MSPLSWLRTTVGTFVAAHALILPQASAQTPNYADGVSIGIVTTSDVWEASGLSASAQNFGTLWTHNDNGMPGSVIALSTNGAYLGRWTIQGLGSSDFEDMAIGPGPNPAFQYIYLGDIGDNDLIRTEIHVYRFAEPAVYPHYAAAPVFRDVLEYQNITLTYPDGPFDAEGMIVDPRTGDLFIFTKLADNSRVYRASRQQLESGATVLLTFVADIPFRRISGAAISHDGSLIAVRRGSSGEIRARGANQTVAEALAGAGSAIPIASEPNGESIAFDPANRGYFTLSEGVTQPLYYYARTGKVPAVPRVFLPAAGSWYYDDFGAPELEGWRDLEFDDSFFTMGQAPLGYNSGETTTIIYGDPYAKTVTTYLRGHFNFSGTAPSNLALRVCFNDGLAVWLNGVEVLRRGLAVGADYGTLASRTNETRRDCWFSVRLDPGLLVAGDNVLAVEVHRADRAGTALNVDAQLVEASANILPAFAGPPRVSGGQVTLRIAGPAGYLVSIEECNTLKNWAPSGSLRLTGGTNEFHDAVSAPQSFYRIAE